MPRRWKCSAARSSPVIARSKRYCLIHPGRSRSCRRANIPPDQAAFLKAYESREAEMIAFLREHKLITLPDYLGPFQIRQLPEAFKPTSPGGFMNPPGLYDKDPPVSFSFPLTVRSRRISTFVLRSRTHGRSSGTKASRDIFMQFQLPTISPTRFADRMAIGVFVEGWALYGEEMLMRTGLYP